jgi:hypothetical protein
LTASILNSGLYFDIDTTPLLMYSLPLVSTVHQTGYGAVFVGIGLVVLYDGYIYRQAAPCFEPAVNAEMAQGGDRDAAGGHGFAASGKSKVGTAAFMPISS